MDLTQLSNLLLGALIFLSMSIGGLGLITLVVVNIPSDHFVVSRERAFLAGKHPVLRWIAVVAKNFAGLVIVAVGIVLAMPGVPGPGLLTIALGLMLLDFPGKRRLELWFITRPNVLGTINRLRTRYRKPPLQIPDRE